MKANHPISHNKTTETKQKAVAISYDPKDFAPKVVAQGQGFVAQKIVEQAKKENVPIYQNESLVEELSRVELGSHIPPELYEIVAQILIFVDDVDKLEAVFSRAKQ